MSNDQFSFTVDVGEDNSLKVHGGNHELVKRAKLVLDDYFAKNADFAVESNNNVKVSAGGDAFELTLDQTDGKFLLIQFQVV